MTGEEDLAMAKVDPKLSDSPSSLQTEVDDKENARLLPESASSEKNNSSLEKQVPVGRNSMGERQEEEKPVVRPKMFGLLKPEEERLIKLSQEGNVQEVRTLLRQYRKIRIDCLDDAGTTPLEHACYKGNKDLVDLFLAAGADVNNNMQTQGYTPLMFAALAGKQEIVRTLLRHGARTGVTNNIGRTASQLAGFVGNHAIAITISNFFTIEDLDYYTVPNGLEKEAKLPSSLAPVVHRFIMQNNLHPVKIIHFLRDNPILQEASVKVLRTLDSIVEKQIKSREMNEIMAMKIHYLACVQRHVTKMTSEGKSIDDMIKLLVRGRDASGFPDYMEKFLRESIRSFPYYQTPLHSTMVHAIAKANLGGSGGSLSILEQSINGQHMAARDSTPCDTCADPEAKKKCSVCHMVAYCNEECQKMHWPVHKKECKDLAVQFVEVERRRVQEEASLKKEQQEAVLDKEEAQQEISSSVPPAAVSGDVEPRTSLQAGAVDEGARSTRSPCAFASLGGNPHQKSQALDNLAEKLKNYANSAAVAAATRVSEAARESGQGDGEASVDVEDINVMIGKEEQDDTAQLLPMPAKKKGKSKNKSHHSSSSR